MGPTPMPNLVGRRRECAVLDELLTGLRAGDSAVCAIRGDAGIGKSVLLEYVAAQASGVTVARAQGLHEARDHLPPPTPRRPRGFLTR